MAKKTIIKKRSQDTTASVVLILSSILLLISVISSYLTMGDYNEKIKDLEKAKQTNQSKQRDLEDAREKVANFSTRVGWLSRDERAISTGDVWNNYTNLKAFLNRMVEYLTANYQIAEYDPWLEKDTQRITAQGELDISVLQESIRQIDAMTTEKIKEGEAKVTELTKKKKEYEERLEKLRNRMELASEGIEIDGKIIMADIDNNSVCIDLGAQDAIVKGMDFDVFTILKGGLKKARGKVKIIKVFDDYSQAAIIPDTMKRDNSIATEDLVNSDIYNRQRIKTFIFAGTPVGKYLLEDLKKKIEEFGGDVLSTLSDNITYVVVGNNFENDDNYKKAIYLGAVVLREKELYDLLRIEWKD